jgi:hypothetical protein
MIFRVIIIICVIIFMFSAIFAPKAYAYLDPGTGSYIYQMLIAAVIGGLFVIKMYWTKIVLFFKGLFSKKSK